MNSFRIEAAAIGSLLLFAAAACGDSGPKIGESRGIVTAVDAHARKITLDHEDIPGMMPAMTMTFGVAPDVSLEGLEPGANVTFELKYEASAYTVTELRR
jgi:Cu/Ag efflux protein CusF